ncbi:MAG: glycosyltransferase family 4 protein [Propioniciclava sp.]|uniref:glycosyltransferase family 4 protein n=1 Tax=Propioniciclava sp. TaxID=2038686 RepID=UPI0039E387E2
MPSDAPATPKIGYVLKMYPRFSETFIVSEILAREAAGEQIVVYSLRPPAGTRFHAELARVQAPAHQVPRASSARGFWASWASAGDDPALATGISRALPLLLAAAHDDAEQAIAVARMALAHGVTHLHAHFASTATTVARLAAAIAGLPYSFTAHAKDIFHAGVDPADLQAKLRDAHHAVTISDYNRRHLRSTFGPDACARLRLVRNGLELDRFPYLPRTQPAPVPRLLAVGRLVEKKGFALLVDAVARLRDRGIVCTLDIVGDGPLREPLAEQIARLDLSDRVWLRGPRTQSEVGAMLRGHDLFVAPFVVGSDGNADGLPTVLLEAMASGIPCVAAAVTAVPEVIRDGETGWLVPTGDVDALTDALIAALNAGAESARITDAAQRLVRRMHDSRAQAATLRVLVTDPPPACGQIDRAPMEVSA